MQFAKASLRRKLSIMRARAGWLALAGWLARWLARWLADWLAGPLAGWLVGWMVSGWFVSGGLIDCLAGLLPGRRLQAADEEEGGWASKNCIIR